MRGREWALQPNWGATIPPLRGSCPQTTSPSYLLMASLDAAQAQARRMRAGRLALPLQSTAAARAELQSMPNITLVENSKGT